MAFTYKIKGGNLGLKTTKGDPEEFIVRVLEFRFGNDGILFLKNRRVTSSLKHKLLQQIAPTVLGNIFGVDYRNIEGLRAAMTKVERMDYDMWVAVVAAMVRASGNMCKVVSSCTAEKEIEF